MRRRSRAQRVPQEVAAASGHFRGPLMLRIEACYRITMTICASRQRACGQPVRLARLVVASASPRGEMVGEPDAAVVNERDAVARARDSNVQLGERLVDVAPLAGREPLPDRLGRGD